MNISPTIHALLLALATTLTAAPVGIFEEATAVGKIDLPGSAVFLPD